MEITSEEHLAAHPIAEALANALGAAVGSNLRPLIQIIVQRERAFSAGFAAGYGKACEEEGVEPPIHEQATIQEAFKAWTDSKSKSPGC